MLWSSPSIHWQEEEEEEEEKKEENKGLSKKQGRMKLLLIQILNY